MEKFLEIMKRALSLSLSPDVVCACVYCLLIIIYDVCCDLCFGKGLEALIVSWTQIMHLICGTYNIGISMVIDRLCRDSKLKGTSPSFGPVKQLYRRCRLLVTNTTFPNYSHQVPALKFSCSAA